MPDTHPTQFDGVTVVAKANVYFDGGVVSHTVLLPDGSKKTLGVIRSGSYRFDTQAPEHMIMTDGACRVKVKGAGDWSSYAAGDEFELPGNSSFEVVVDEGIAQYICTFK